MALRCLVEKVGRIGYNNHVKTKLGFYGAVVNNYQHPPSRHSSFRWYSRKRYRTSLGPPDTSDCLEIYPDYWKYSQQVDASEGFDVEAGLHLGPIGGGIHPYWWGSMDDPEITEPALVAVQQYNKQQNTNLEFVRVVKATMQCICGMRYYITLEAMDNGVKNTYQTKMWLNAGKNCIWVLELFRLAPDNRSNLIDKQDVMEKLDKEGVDNETKNVGDGLDDIDSSLSVAPTHNTRNSTKECCSQRRKRKSRSSGNLLEAIKEVGFIMGMVIRESTNKLIEALGYDVAVAETVKINEELLKLPAISMFERHKATLQIARDHETTDVFFTIADDEKEEWVKALLRGDI